MKVFQGNESSWSEKVNFVDENDVFVGYDMGQDCCEHAGWYITDHIFTYDNYVDMGDEFPTPDLEDYYFDKDFVEEHYSAGLDGGSLVVFRLLSDDVGKPDLFLHIFNAHNGYYGHGFEVKHGGVTVNAGVL